MRGFVTTVALVLLVLPAPVRAQGPGRFPPDSLVNTQVIPKGTPVPQVIGTMRNISMALGVRCQFCHVGEEGKPLSTFNFPSDDKPTKLVARQMMRMVEEINRRLDTLPHHGMSGQDMPHVEVTCRTCHRGVEEPIPLYTLVVEATLGGGADSGVATYGRLREQYYGRDAYDFGESSLNIAAFRVARENHIADALVLLGLNETMFPGSSGLSVFRGNVLLMGGDTTAAANAYREAIRRDSTNGEARGRLREVGQAP